MAFLAKYDGTCYRCKGPITPGQMISQMNLPKPKTRFHQTCPKAETIPGETIPASPEPQGRHPDYQEANTGGTPGKAPAAPAGSIDAIIDARIDARLEGFEPGDAMDQEAIQAMIDAHLGARPVQITITRQDGTEARADGEHHNFERLIRLYNAGIRTVYIWGPAGTGKTTAAMRVATALGLNWELEGLDGSSPRSQLFGYRTPHGEAVQTPFTRTYTDPKGALVIDELDGAPGPLQVNLNASLANGHASAAWGPLLRGEGYGLWGTGNTPGRPTPAHPERKPMAGAFKDRLYFMHWPLDRNIERRLTGRALVAPPARKGEAREITASAWGRWVETIRGWAEQNAPSQIHVSTRAVIEGLKALAAGETPEEVADGLIFKGADDALVAKALAACPIP